MQIKDIMTKNVEVVGPDSTLQEAADKMKSLDVGVLPVCDGERLLGMITDRDITVRCVAEGCDPAHFKVSEVMTDKLIYCFEDENVRAAAEIMQEQQIRRLPILSRDKKLVGIVSLGDLVVQVGDERLAGETIKRVSESPRTRS